MITPPTASTLSSAIKFGREADATPKPPKWGDFVPGDLPQFTGRKLRVCQFCPGTDVGDAEHSLGIQIEFMNIYDLEPRYKDM